MTGTVRKRIRILFIILAVLAMAQLAWWSYLLIGQQAEISQLLNTEESLLKRDRFLFMILTEGVFWLIMWTMGLFYIYRTIKQERNLYKAHRDFLSGITHELKTPIANIQLCLQGLQRSNIDKDKQAVFIERALSATEKLYNEIQSILKLNQQAQASQRPTEDFILQECLEQVIAQLNEESQAFIEVSSFNKDIKLKTEREGFEIILRSLIENAVKYSQIRCKTEKDFVPKIHIQFDDKSIQITDNGIGILREERSLVLQEFYRGEYAKKLAIPGTGVGLSIANQIALRLNMSLKISSEGSNQGSQIELSYKK